MKSETHARMLHAIREFRRAGANRGPLPGEARAMRHRVQDLLDEMRRISAECERRHRRPKREGADRLLESLMLLAPRVSKGLSKAEMSPVAEEFHKLIERAQHRLDEADGRTRRRASPEHRIQRRYRLALGYVRRTRQIYENLGHRRGLAHCKIDEGYVQLEAGRLIDHENLPLAVRLAEEAFDIGQGNKTAQARAAILCTAAAYACFEEGVGDGRDYGAAAREWAERAKVNATGTEPRIESRAAVWMGITRFIDAKPDRQTAIECRNEVIDNLRRFPGGSLQREFELLRRLLDSGGAGSGSELLNWLYDPWNSGLPFDKLEIEITRRAWQATGTMPQFMKLLDLHSNNKALGLLSRAAIDVPKCKSPRRDTTAGTRITKRAC